MQIWVKGVVEHGSFLRNPSLGAPFGLSFHDYPRSDSLHFFLIRLLSFTGAPYPVIFNLYYLLTFPLTTISTLFVLRHFKVSYVPTLVGSLLFAFLPYHFTKIGHYFEAAYYLVPLTVMVALWVYLDNGPFCAFDEDRQRPRWRFWNRRSYAAAAICLLVSSAGVYYAFFGCFAFFIVACAAALRQKVVYPVFQGGLLIAALGLGVLANIAPTIIYQHKYGANPLPAVRAPDNAELLGLKISQMLQPIPGHRLTALATARARYDQSAPLVNENGWSSLGAIGAIGFLWLLGRLLTRSAGSSGHRVQDALSCLAIFLVLLGTVGGFGSLFSYFVSPSIRAYTRICVYVAFVSFFAVALVLDKLWRRYATRVPSKVALCGLLAVLTTLGVLDQTCESCVPRYQSIKEVYTRDAAFVREVEAVLPERAMIFQLPYMPFPEGPRIGEVERYDPARGYLHSRTLRWSFGSMKGRSTATWHQDVAGKPAAEMVKVLSATGFSGIFIDRFGFADRACQLEAELGRLLDTRPLVSADQRFSFLAMARTEARSENNETAKHTPE
jgi:phosphoglycerol transferase